MPRKSSRSATSRKCSSSTTGTRRRPRATSTSIRARSSATSRSSRTEKADARYTATERLISSRMVALMTLLFVAVVPGPQGATADPSIEARIDELESENPRKRRLAAMSLRRMTKKYTRVADREHGDEVQIMEARQALMVFDDDLTRTCIDQLAVQNLTGLCADILGLLGNEKAEAPLESQ